MVFEIELPRGAKDLRMPPALNRRLSELLDRQDLEGKLSAKERREAEALADLTELLSLLKLQAKRKTGRSKR